MRVANSAVTADLTFCRLPLHRRMKLAGKLHEHEFVELAHPTGYFARQGGLVDKLIRRLRTAHAGGDGARAAANQGGWGVAKAEKMLKDEGRGTREVG